MSPSVVTFGVQLTDLPLSASVNCFHSEPPHCGPGAAAPTCAPTTRASFATPSAKTNRIVPSMARNRIEPQRDNHRPTVGRTLSLFGELHAEIGEQEEQADAGHTQGEHEPRSLALS